MTVWLIMLVLLAPANPEPDEAAKSIYYRALKDARAGRYAAALQGYQTILDSHPGDAFADDALMEQARITEELLGKPAAALSLYQKLLADYPDSRLVRRARARSDFIGKHLDQGEAVLDSYQTILRKSAKQPPLKAVLRMEDLLEQFPKFSLRPDGLYWIGSVLAREDLAEQAIRQWNQVVESYPDHPVAGQALVGIANLAMGSGDMDLAERSIKRLARMPKERWRKAAAEASGKLERLRRLRWIFFTALVAWLVVLAALWIGLVMVLRKGRLPAKRLVRPPVEFLVFAAVMAGLVIWAATGTRQTTRALLWLSGMVGLLVLPNGWLLRCWIPRGLKLSGWLLMLVLACLAAMVVAVGLSGMSNQVLHTLKWGPA